MKHRQFVTYLGLLCILIATPALSDAARIKCWTNNEGVRECGNAVPPEYAQKGHKEVSKSGLTVKTQKAARTKENREAEKAAEIAKAERARQEEKRHRKQAAADRVLLDTFVTENDLVLAHQRKVQAIESQITHRRKHISKLETKLSKHQRTAANKERGGKKVSEQTLAKIDDVQKQLDDSESFIRGQYREMDKLEHVYTTDLGRYRFLKSGGEIGAPPQT